VSSVGKKLVGRQTEPFGDFLDREGAILSGNVEIAHGLSLTNILRWRSEVKKTRAMPGDIARDESDGKTMLIENVLRWIKRLTVDLDHVVKMGTGCEPAASHETHHIASLHALPFFH
jgi:hypothetical protein